MTRQLALTPETGGMCVGYGQQATAEHDNDPNHSKYTTFHTSLIGRRNQTFTRRTKFRCPVKARCSDKYQSINRATAVPSGADTSNRTGTQCPRISPR